MYDPLGRLSWYTNSGAVLDHEGSRMVTELNDTANYAVLKRYVHGPGTDEPLVSYDGTGTANRRWLHADERGSIIAQSDASGVATNTLRFDEYGIPASTKHPAGSSIPARCGCRRLGSTTTRRAPTTRGLGGSCSRTRSAMTMG
ncbi:MAG TPA: hypothetical protein VF680_10280 [Allosphingosinicella sp.]|jgi:hypothetical protein